MKNRILIVTALIFSASVILLVVRRNQPSSKIEELNSISPTNSSSGVPDNSNSQPLTAVDLARERLERQATLRRTRDEWRVPLNFYGKVVDENGTPVANADVIFGWNNLYGSPEKKVKTRDDGTFSLEREQGKVLMVKASKDGYYASKANPPYFFYSGETVNFKPDPMNPVIYHLRKKGVADQLIVVKRNLRVSREGVPLRLDLEEGQTQAVGDAVLQVECWTKDLGKRSGEHYDWLCRISIIGGGLIESTNEFDFLAPESGYKENYEIQMFESQTTGWKNDVEKRLIYKLPNGMYGRMTFAMIAAGDHFCMIESYLNPSGSRNLEFDPHKAIRKP